MKILVIDGQGGKMGAALTDQIKKNMPDAEVVAVGTNSLATSAMLRAGADAAACVKSTCFNMTKAGYAVHVLSDCVTSYDKAKLDEMLEYYASKGSTVEPLAAAMQAVHESAASLGG